MIWIRRATCFIILVSLFFNISIASVRAGITLIDDENVTVSATVGGVVTTQPPGGDGGSLSGPITLPVTSIRFSGEAAPGASIALLKNGTYITSVLADSSGVFNITLEEKYDGTIVYSLQATYPNGEKSLLINYPLVVSTGYLTYLSGVRFPPTITLDKVAAKVGDFLSISGYATPNKEMGILIKNQNIDSSKKFTLTVPQNGRYTITLPLTDLPAGDYVVSVKHKGDTRKSKLVRLTIGDKNISSVDITQNIPGDCNADGQINLVDFSVLAFWYKKPHPPTCEDTNNDNIVDLTDFSILAFYWTN